MEHSVFSGNRTRLKVVGLERIEYAIISDVYCRVRRGEVQLTGVKKLDPLS
jgi:hypothetical protein